MKKIILIIISILLLVGIYFVIFNQFIFKNQTGNNVLSPTQLTSLQNINWSKAQETSQQTFYGLISGRLYTFSISSNEAQIQTFENKAELSKLGFILDSNLAASGPGSNIWGYKKVTNGKTQIILFSYRTRPSSNKPDEPLQFNCPCAVDLNIFISDSFSMTTSLTPTSSTLPNPASENCIQKGGTLRILKRGDGGEYGLCDFGDNMACEEWALLRGQCPVGGLKTTGYDNIQQMYCAWLGGKTLAVPNAKCTLPSGKTCSVDDVYNGKC